jgi:hypothetical protein
MKHVAAMRACPRFLIGLLVVWLLAGCGGGASNPVVTPPTPDPIEFRDPVENATLPGSVGGTVFTLESQIIDQAFNAQLTLTGLTDDGQQYTARTASTVRGGYLFRDVPAGTYELTAYVKAPSNANELLVGRFTGIRVRGNIPTLMQNILLGKELQLATFTGVITRDGAPVNGAVVTIDVTAHSPALLEGDPEPEASVLISMLTDDQGRYTVQIPTGGKRYFVAAHASGSSMSESEEINLLNAGETRTVNLALSAPEQATVFPYLVLDIIAATLPAPTAEASNQVMITRLAAARALQAPANRIAWLEKMAAARHNTRNTGSFVENDLYWFIYYSPEWEAAHPDLYVDPNVRGYNVYRSASVQGPYTKVGIAPDPYQQQFFDNDPALQIGNTIYYTVTSFASDGASVYASPIVAKSLPVLTVSTPTHGQIVARADAKVHWEPVPDALSYLVLIFNKEPTYNTNPVQVRTLDAGITESSLSSLLPGDYWVSVSAYNIDSTKIGYATAASYSTFLKVTLTE